MADDQTQFDIEAFRARNALPMPKAPTITPEEVSALYGYLYGAQAPRVQSEPPPGYGKVAPSYPVAQSNVKSPWALSPGFGRVPGSPVHGPMSAGLPAVPMSAGGTPSPQVALTAPPMPPKDQSRLPSAPGALGAFMPGRGARWTPPPTAGGGGADGGAVPGGSASPSMPSGPMTWQQVVKSVADANPELTKDQNGRAVIAMAAMQLLPLMDRQSQMQMQQITKMMQMQMQQSRLQLSESRLDLAEERLKTYKEKSTGKDSAARDREYQNAISNYQRAANNLAQNRGDKNLQDAFTRAKSRLDSLDAQRAPSTPQSGAANFVRGKTPDQVISALPRDMMSKLSPAEQKQFAQMLIDMPEKAQEAIDALDSKLSRRSTTEVQKSYGSSR